MIFGDTKGPFIFYEVRGTLVEFSEQLLKSDKTRQAFENTREM